MSFASEVKQEVAQKVMSGSDARAELSALVQMCSSLSLSSRGMTLLITVENAAVARRVFSLLKERYDAQIEMFVKRKMNLKKNRIYGLRILSGVTDILKDLGIYSSRGLLDKPLARIVQTDNNARAYLAGAFLASGSINPPEKTQYHLEIVTNSQEHADFLIRLLERFDIRTRSIPRRSKFVVYVKAAEKIGDFLRLIEADQALMKFENIRISRDFTNSITRLNNMDVANEMKTQAAAARQLEDIRILEEAGRVEKLDEKLQDVIALRREFPDSSLNELAEIYERRTGTAVSKSGMKHRFVRIHEMAEKIAGRS
ncbi:MAG: DNA-binding protein WhiA [Erysipelotrichaceae bacterium]|nr:DNA-binding protein WhiA [Erysipelotrichaceae bacterium]